MSLKLFKLLDIKQVNLELCCYVESMLALWGQTLPDDLHICVQEAQILATVCHHWHTAGTHQSVLQLRPHLRSPQPHPVEIKLILRGLSFIKHTNYGNCYDSTFEIVASLNGPLSGVGMDLENMQFFAVRTKLPSTSSTGSFSAERKKIIKTLSI